ncbi:pancreatic triacylglycerol lipase [Aplysia californica]|uniref:Pancreatic triacylglycerol lipase n=1 Tax=Aplysia californica TaxID=6500 RepID=A0ABM1A5B6_APLCA|nr:pancreatic triacylglycerol lipase [Aplysia californica]
MGLLFALLLLCPALALSADSTPAPYRKECYGNLGCFDNKAPYDNAQGKIPNSPSAVGTVFRLFTRRDKINGHDLKYDDASSLTSAHFSGSKPTKFVIHGFGGSISNQWMVDIKNALLDKGDYNVVLVGWAKGAVMPLYAQAVANTRLVAAEIKALVNEMVAKGLNLNNLHLIGHSLGAQISGNAGRLLGGHAGRITGMDPARPSYEFKSTTVRLDSSDAKFVDVIHTNGLVAQNGGLQGYGVFQQTGTVDFYVNGGEKQPGCKDISAIADIWDKIFGKRDIGQDVSCSHGRSHDYFLESIKSHCAFTGYKCASYADYEKGLCKSCSNNGCNVMGFNADPHKARGKLYLDTKSASPFCS